MNDLNNNKPFKTPEDYFENHTDKVLNKMNSESSLPDEDGFIAPEGYFEALNQKIKERLDDETEVKRLPAYRKFYWVAASIAAVLIVVFGINQGSSDVPNWDDLATADFEAYLDTNEFGLTTFEIAEIIPVDELEVTDVLDNPLNEENIINYLDNNIDDFEELNLNADE